MLAFMTSYGMFNKRKLQQIINDLEHDIQEYMNIASQLDNNELQQCDELINMMNRNKEKLEKLLNEMKKERF